MKNVTFPVIFHFLNLKTKIQLKAEHQIDDVDTGSDCFFSFLFWFPSHAEAVPSAGDERDGVHQSHPDTPDQSGTGLCPESTDQRAGLSHFDVK